MHWHYVCTRNELKSKQRHLFRQAQFQIVLFWVNETVYAMDNRCPHEGYPLMQGELNTEHGSLTCHWHNWKFGLKTGQALVGQDAVRIYPTEFRDQELWIDLSPPAPEELKKQRLQALQEAFGKRQYGRMARELTRMHYQGLAPEDALVAAFEWAHTRLEFGATHAQAVAADWLSLSREAQHLPYQLAPLTEALDHLALDVLGKKEFPYPEGQAAFSRPAFLAAVEAENEVESFQLLRGAWHEGLHFKDLLPDFVAMALAHYNDFGHSLIYVQKTQELLEQLDGQAEQALTLGLLRSLLYATREDLLPEFKAYGPAFKEFRAFGTQDTAPQVPKLNSVSQLLHWLVDVHQDYTAEALYQALLSANGENLLYFDETLQEQVEVKPADSAGWLSVTHALTFANAVRSLCSQYPQYWWAGLLQMAAFYGRNLRFTQRESVHEQNWQVHHASQFWQRVYAQLQDHGLSAPIFAAHWVKTALAVRAELNQTEIPLSPHTRTLLLAALNRFLQADLKQKQVQRTLYQSIELVKRDFETPS